MLRHLHVASCLFNNQALQAKQNNQVVCARLQAGPGDSTVLLHLLIQASTMASRGCLENMVQHSTCQLVLLVLHPLDRLLNVKLSLRFGLRQASSLLVNLLA